MPAFPEPAEKHAVTCASNRGRQCNCPVRRRAEEARKRQEAYDRAFAEIILLECKLDRAWERLLYEILGLEAG